MTGRGRGIVRAGLLLGALGLAAGGCAPPAPRVHRVAIRGFAFVPAATAAAPGDTVAWTNDDVVVHSATSAGWDSGPIAPGATWKLVVGEHPAAPYHCTLHPTMKGELAAAK